MELPTTQTAVRATRRRRSVAAPNKWWAIGLTLTVVLVVGGSAWIATEIREWPR